MLLLCILVGGVSSAWGEKTYTYTLSSGANSFYTDSNLETHPSSGSSNAITSFYASDGKQFTCSQASVYFSAASSGYLFLTKGAKLTLPTYSGEKITKVSLSNSSGCSTSVQVSIVSGSNTASSSQTWTTQSSTYNYNVGSGYQSSTLGISVANKNAQITQIVITTESTAGTTDAPSISGDTPFVGSTTVTINNAASADGASIYYTLNGDDPTTTTSATCFAYSTPFTVDATTTVKAIAKKSTDTNASSVVNKTFTKVTPMTVSDALTAISALASNGTIAEQCVSGVVCTAGSLSSGAITYYISADGTESSRLQVYKGKGLNNADFETAGDIAVGDEVVIYGTLKNYGGNTPEFDAGNYLLSKVRKPSPELAWSGDSYTATYGGSISYPTLTNPNSVMVMYSSSDTNIATIDPSTGVITLKANGETDITASFVGDATYSAQEVSYTLTVEGMLEAPGFSFANAEINMVYDEDYEGQGLTNPNSVTVSYVSSDTDVADVDENTGIVALYKAGTVTITANFAGNATYASGSASYTINVNKAKAGLAFADAGPYYVAPSADFDVPALTNPHELTVDWSSTDDDIAVADGSVAVIGSKLGTAIITASFAGDDRYKAGNASYTIIVTNDEIVTWDLSTDQTATATTTSMTWTNTNVTMSAAKGSATTNTNNYYPGTSNQNYTSTRFYKNSTLTIAPLNGYAIKSVVFTATTSGYATALANSQWTNATATASTTSEPYTVTVTPEDGSSALSVTMGNTNGHTSVVVNLAKSFEVKLNASGYATFATNAPVSYSNAEFSAWQITAANSSTEVITFSKITGAVAPGTGVLLMGTPDATVSIPVAASGATLATNKLTGITTATEVTVDQYYGLSDNKFVKVNAGTVPAGKALLPVSAVGAGVKEFVFDFGGNDADGIKNINPALSEGEGTIYNLAGQRLQRPQKGINIVNGKKILF